MKPNQQNVRAPRHIAIIMDGNGRWAKQRGKSRLEGHKQGALQIKKVIEASVKLGVKFLTLYAFSSENWSRPKAEVTALMRLLEVSIKTNAKYLVKNSIKFETIGDISALPAYCRKAIDWLKNKTKNFGAFTLVLALNYGSRDEIVRAVKSCAEAVKNHILEPEKISWEEISKRLDTAPFPDPDLIIRTSGEMRLSNYLMLQAAYAELYFTKVNWPDFGEEEIIKAVEEFASRERRYGKTTEQLGG